VPDQPALSGFDNRRLERLPWVDRSVWIRLAPFPPCGENGWPRGQELSSPFGHAPRHVVAARRPARTATPRPPSLAPSLWTARDPVKDRRPHTKACHEAMRLLEPCNRLSKISSTRWTFGSWWIARSGCPDRRPRPDPSRHKSVKSPSACSSRTHPQAFNRRSGPRADPSRELARSRYPSLASPHVPPPKRASEEGLRRGPPKRSSLRPWPVFRDPTSLLRGTLRRGRASDQVDRS